MFCTKCGTGHTGSASVCSECGAPLLTAAPTGGEIESHLTAAILVTLMCCVPFGIPAIVYAAGVNGKVAAGDLAGAREASRKAKMWCWVGFGSGLAVVLIYLLSVAIGVATGNLG